MTTYLTWNDFTGSAIRYSDSQRTPHRRVASMKGFIESAARGQSIIMPAKDLTRMLAYLRDSELLASLAGEARKLNEVLEDVQFTIEQQLFRVLAKNAAPKCYYLVAAGGERFVIVATGEREAHQVRNKLNRERREWKYWHNEHSFDECTAGFYLDQASQRGDL